MQKKLHVTSILRMIAIETVKNLYPNPDWIHFYSCRSLLNYTGIEGAGMCSNLFSFYSQLGKRNVFHGEVAAMCMALTQRRRAGSHGLSSFVTIKPRFFLCILIQPLPPPTSSSAEIYSGGYVIFQNKL